MDKTWTVVKFIVEEAVEAVPTSWILNNKCYWPPFNKEKIVKLIKKNNEHPNTCWPLHDILIFRNSTFDDYLTARRKANKAEHTSDLNSSDTDNGKRKIIRKRVSSSSEDEASDIQLNTPPRMNTSANLKKSDKGINRNRDISETINENIPTESQKSCQCCPMHQYDGYFEEIIKKQNILRAQIKQLSDDFQNLKWPQTNDKMIDPACPSLFEIFKCPITTVDEIDEIETFLSQQSNFNAAVVEMSKMGGRSAYDFIKRTISSLLTDELAQEYSWLGAKKKRIFGKLKMAELLQKSAETSLRITYKESEEAVKKWLRRAKERAMNKNRSQMNP